MTREQTIDKVVRYALVRLHGYMPSIYRLEQICTCSCLGHDVDRKNIRAETVRLWNDVVPLLK